MLGLDRLAAWHKKRRRQRKFEVAQSWSKDRGLQEVFEGIYAEGKWGRAPEGTGQQFWSGNGSKPDYSLPYERFMAGFLDRHRDVTTIVDIGCGDFQVSGRMLASVGRPVEYIGCDVVRPLIEHHTQVHGGPSRRFMVVNAVEEDPPAGDLVILRQILQHLSNAQISSVLERVRRLYRLAIITESLPIPAGQPNLDIVHGIATRVALGSGVWIEKPPFGLEIEESFEVGHGPHEVLRTSVVRLAR
jgi:hypothetical protein